MRPAFWAVLLVGFLAPVAPIDALNWNLVEVTSATAEVQWVRATPLDDAFQASWGLGWTAGLELERAWTLRGGLSVRRVPPSVPQQGSLYLGYQGWGWTAALDALPGTTASPWGRWSWGGTLAYRHETLAYPGLFRSFSLDGWSAGPLLEWAPPETEGLGVRLVAPTTLDQRPDFSRSLRVGLELALLLRGGGGGPR